MCWVKTPSWDPDSVLLHVAENTKVFNCCSEEIQVLVIIVRKSQVSNSWVYHNSVLHSKTNKCTYVTCIYHVFFITDMFQPLLQSSSSYFTGLQGVQTLLKCISKPFTVTKHVSNCLYSQLISAY
jgi:hypothetical protein